MEATKPRSRNAQGILAGPKSPRVMTAKPDPLAFGDEVRLTTDERRTLIFLARGFSLREIQTRLDVGRTVVSRHRASILRKLDARNDAHAVLKAFQQEIIT